MFNDSFAAEAVEPADAFVKLTPDFEAELIDILCPAEGTRPPARDGQEEP